MKTDVPQFFRFNIEVGDLEKAIAFYTKLLDIQGRKLTVDDILRTGYLPNPPIKP